MNDLFISIKVVDTNTNIIKWLEESLISKEHKFYTALENDKEVLTALEYDKEYSVLFIVFSKNDTNDYEAQRIYLGKGTVLKSGNMQYIINSKLDSSLVVENYILSSGLDHKDDFDSNSNVWLESYSESLRQLKYIGSKPYRVETVSYEDQFYPRIKQEDTTIHRYGQKNIDCRRGISKLGSDKTRPEFQRDRARVVHARAFRRLVDKAQIFTSSKGIYYRTRMTHTLEVSQIARGIAKTLGLNVDLTEAIALSHDIGHTPFGHQGERTLNDIMNNKIEVIKNAEEQDLHFGGFKHNYQGLRVVSYLEEKYLDHEGLDLSYQVLEGMLKHTGGKVKGCPCGNCDNKCYDIYEFMKNGDAKYLFLEHKFPTTLEGQIVSIADEIAQRGHDLDDAFASSHLTFDELIKHSKINKMKPIHDALMRVKEELDALESKNRVFIDKVEMLRARIVPEILSFFVGDVIKQSLKNIEEYEETDFFRENHRFDKQLIGFSSDGEFIIEYIEKIITRKVINSFEVARFDEKAKTIITELFKFYYANPKLLPDTTLKRIFRDIKEVSSNVIDFRAGNPKLISKELDRICNMDIYAKGIDENIHQEYKMKRVIFVRCIVDSIAGMTDNFAINEYNDLMGIIN